MTRRIRRSTTGSTTRNRRKSMPSTVRAKESTSLSSRSKGGNPDRRRKREPENPKKEDAKDRKETVAKRGKVIRGEHAGRILRKVFSKLGRPLTRPKNSWPKIPTQRRSEAF